MGLAIPVHRAAVFVLDEVHDDGIESLPAAILEVWLRLFPGEADDQKPWRVALDEKRSAALVHHMAMVRAKPERVGTGRKSNGDEPSAPNRVIRRHWTMDFDLAYQRRREPAASPLTPARLGCETRCGHGRRVAALQQKFVVS